MNPFDENPFSRDLPPVRADADHDSALQRLVFRLSLGVIVCFGLVSFFFSS